MNNESERAKGRAGRWLGPLLWVGGSFLLFYVLFFDPLNGPLFPAGEDGEQPEPVEA